MGTAIFSPLRCKEREPLAGLSFEGAVTCALRSEGCYDVREHVLDLVAHRKKDHDDDDRNEDEDQGVLNHSLAFLTGRKAAKFHVKAQHFCDFTSFFLNYRFLTCVTLPGRTSCGLPGLSRTRMVLSGPRQVNSLAKTTGWPASVANLSPGMAMTGVAEPV